VLFDRSRENSLETEPSAYGIEPDSLHGQGMVRVLVRVWSEYGQGIEPDSTWSGYGQGMVRVWSVWSEYGQGIEPDSLHGQGMVREWSENGQSIVRVSSEYGQGIEPDSACENYIQLGEKNGCFS